MLDDRTQRTTAPLIEVPEPLTARPRSEGWRGSVQRLARDRKALFSLIGLLFFLGAALAGPLVYRASPTYGDFLNIRAFPSWAHPLGTDSLGRDTLARLLDGLRVTFFVAAFVESLNVVFGVGVGIIAGYFRGIADALLSRLADLLFAFPGLLFAILVAGAFGQGVSLAYGGAGRLLLTSAALAIVGWPLMARYIRGVTLALRERDFVTAARSLGAGDWWIIRYHILPNVSGLVIVATTLDIVGVIAGEATLSLLGLGIQPPGSSLGLMINDAKDYLTQNWTQEFSPCAVLTILVLIFSFLGDGLRDVVDARTSGS